MKLTVGLLLVCRLVGALAATGGGSGSRATALSRRSGLVESFKVMDVLRRAGELEREGKSVLHLEVGQPQTGAPRGVREAAASALDSNRLGYTDALGVGPLRKRIAQHYHDKYGVKIAEERVVVTTGSSGAFLLAFLASFDVGDKVAVASSSYPCYRHILNAFGCDVVTIDTNAEYKVTAAELRSKMEEMRETGEEPLKGIILRYNRSSPSYSTALGRQGPSLLGQLWIDGMTMEGRAMLSAEELEGLCQTCQESGVMFISDEIYHGITFGKKDETALAFVDNECDESGKEGGEEGGEGGSNCMVINSFSKYYSMTGWRLGWMVVPQRMVSAVNRLAQNLYINAPTLSQLAAVAAFDCRQELEQHIEKYALNRAILLEGLADMGFTSVAPSDGAFYVYVDTSKDVLDSAVLARDLLEDVGVAITPGTDFECPHSDKGTKRVRFSFCGSTEHVRQSMVRMKEWWRTYPKRLPTSPQS